MKTILKKVLLFTCVLSLLNSAISVQASEKKQILLNTTTLELNVGGSEQLVVSTKPYKKGVVYTWKSSNEDVVRILENGIIFGAMTGEATVTVAAKGYIKAKCKVDVVSKIASNPTMDTENNKKAITENNRETKSGNDDNNATKKIVLDNSDLNLDFAFAQKLTASTNQNDKDVKLTWESSNDKVVRVFDNGYIFGNGVGEATIKVSAEGYKPAECKVKVEANYNSPSGDPNKKIVYEDTFGTALENYDKDTVTGNTLRQAISELKGTPYIVAVATKAFMECTRDTYKGSVPYNNVNIMMAGTYASAFEYSWAINYNALIAEPHLRLDLKINKDKFGNQKDYFMYYGTMKTENGAQVFNNNYDDLQNEENTAYINKFSTYKVELIINQEGKLIGILFVEK